MEVSDKNSEASGSAALLFNTSYCRPESHILKLRSRALHPEPNALNVPMKVQVNLPKHEQPVCLKLRKHMKLSSAFDETVELRVRRKGLVT